MTLIESLRRLTLRPWKEFFKVAEFNMPQRDILQQRISTNLIYYQGNYLLISAVLFIYMCTVRLFFLFFLPLTVVGFHLLTAYPRPIVLGKNTLPKAHAVLAYLTLCILLSLIFGGSTFVGVLTMITLLTLAHAVFRQRATTGRALTFMDLWQGATAPAGSGRAIDEDESDDEDPGRTNSSTSGGDGDQQQFRAQFRAKMRQKYLKK